MHISKKSFYYFIPLFFLTLTYICYINSLTFNGNGLTMNNSNVIQPVATTVTDTNSNPALQLDNIPATAEQNNFVTSVSAFQSQVIDPVLIKMNLYSAAASRLLLGTAIQESLVGKLSKNIFQIQVQTVEDLNKNYLSNRPQLENSINAFYNAQHSISWNINNNINYEIAIARVIYLRADQQLPAASNIDGLANTWKKDYNTFLGKGTPNEFKVHFIDYVSVDHPVNAIPTENV